jgi:hypothetical protein
MQRGLARVFRACVDVSPLLDQELAESPMAMERRAMQPEVFPERPQRLAVAEQEPHRADVAIVSAPSDQWHAVGSQGSGRMALSDVVPDQVGATIDDPLEQSFWFHPRLTVLSRTPVQLCSDGNWGSCRCRCSEDCSRHSGDRQLRIQARLER